MEDGGWGWIFRGIMWVLLKIANLIGAGIQMLYLGIFRVTAVTPVKKDTKYFSEQDESRRLAGCEDVVRAYATDFGYIARECMSVDELDEKITNGISPEDLNLEIQTRMQVCPGIVLGTFAQTGMEVKLPLTWRQRHLYIVGRSGSGKTNIIKNMVWQDVALGNGLGAIAPEQELMTEEILPYIPQERIDDVVYFNPADTEYPVPFNPLHLDVGEDIDLKVDDTFTIFKRLVGEIVAYASEGRRPGESRPYNLLRQVSPST